jgi:hypothetical protein
MSKPFASLKKELREEEIVPFIGLLRNASHVVLFSL